MPTIRIESRAEAKDYIEHIHSTNSSYCHVIEPRDNQQPIGIVGLNQRSNEDYPDLGYAVVPDFEGFGYAFEACTLYLQQLNEFRHSKIIIAVTDPLNHRSVGLLKRLGFRIFRAANGRKQPYVVYMLNLRKLAAKNERPDMS